MATTETERVLRQVRSGKLDESRLLPSADKRARDVVKKLDRLAARQGLVHLHGRPGVRGGDREGILEAKRGGHGGGAGLCAGGRRCRAVRAGPPGGVRRVDRGRAEQSSAGAKGRAGERGAGGAGAARSHGWPPARTARSRRRGRPRPLRPWRSSAPRQTGPAPSASRPSTPPTGPASRRRTTRLTPSSASWSRTARRSWRTGRPPRTARAASPSSTAPYVPRRGGPAPTPTAT